jgi:hypothetical protein
LPGQHDQSHDRHVAHVDDCIRIVYMCVSGS